MATRGTGLLMEWVDVDPACDAEFNKWYNRVEIGRFSGVAGVLSTGRYEAIEGGPKYLAMFELEDHEVLRSAAFLDARYRAMPASPASTLQVGRNYLKLGYRQIFPTTLDAVDLTREIPRYLQLGRMDIPAHREEEFNDWYNTAYIPPYLAVEGCISARRFVAIEGQPKYLTLYELADPEIRHSRTWDLARSSNPWSARFKPLQHAGGSPGIYRRIYPE